MDNLKPIYLELSEISKVRGILDSDKSTTSIYEDLQT